jgi:D-alanyl-D-alanine carboxypeptidase
MPYERYIQDEVFDRAGMKGAAFLQTDGIDTETAIGYTRDAGSGKLRSNVFMKPAGGSAAGGVYATAIDLLAFDAALRSGILSSDRPAGGGDSVIAGGSAGSSTALAFVGPWTVIVLTNFDPPLGLECGAAVARALGH